MQLTPGALLGPYRVEALIARGGMGAVYRATRNDGALVALKVLTAQGQRPEQLTRFEREAELTARLSHPAIVRVHGAGSAAGLHYIAMDLIVGEPLSQHCGRLAPLEAARLVAQVARAIEHAHERGVLHRDLKPGNVLVRREDGQALITDFGIARALEDGSALTRTGALIGTPLYMAPEQATGKTATTATDVHGLGVLLYEAITGKPPFEQPDLAAVLIALTGSVPAPPSRLRPGTPRTLDRLCMAALEKDPGRRPSAGALAAGLEDVVAGRTAARRPRAGATFVLIGAAAAAALAAAWPHPQEALGPEPVMTALPTPPPPPGATTTSPQPVDPPWLRSLLEGGPLESLRELDDALRGDALRAVDAPTRARAARALEALDAGWRDPRAPGQLLVPQEGAEAMREAFARLIYLHGLWRRFDPRHELPPHRRAVIDELALQGALGRDDGPRITRALVELAPDDLEAHILYAQTGDALARDEATLTRGLALADAARNDDAWALITATLAQVLHAAIVGADADTTAARTSFDALLQEALARADRQPGAAGRVLHFEARIALHDERFDHALQALARALPLVVAPWEVHRTSLSVHLAALRATGAETHREGALAHFDALLRVSASGTGDAPRAQRDLALGAPELARFLILESWPMPALNVLDRALEVLPAAAGAECSFLRAILLARAAHEAQERLPLALADLLQRLDARRAELQARFGHERPVQAALAALAAVVREASSRLPRSAADREALARALEEHPGRAYLAINSR